MTLSKTEKIVSWSMQLVVAGILLPAGAGKLRSDQSALTVFEALEMGPEGMIIIGLIEVLASVLILTPGLVHLGALLGFGTMLGALLAHISTLGFSGDSGVGAVLLSVVIAATSVVMFLHREKLPVVGIIFREDARSE